jgi:hypothetical protein
VSEQQLIQLLEQVNTQDSKSTTTVSVRLLSKLNGAVSSKESALMMMMIWMI